MSTQPEDDPPDAPDEEPLDDRAARNLVVGLAIAVEGGLILLAWLIGWLIETPPLTRFRFDVSGLMWGVAAALPMLVGFFLAASWPVGPLRPIKEFTDTTIRPLMAPCSLIDLAGISLLAGLGEELLFRGVLQVAFDGWMPLWAAIVTSAALFGLLHAVTPTYALLATLIGAYLGVVFHYSENLLSVVVAHALYDFVALLWVTRGPQEGKGTRMNTDQTDENGSEEMVFDPCRSV
jgi:membrane protease YdiL (CAAX protease family)